MREKVDYTVGPTQDILRRIRKELRQAPAKIGSRFYALQLSRLGYDPVKGPVEGAVAPTPEPETPAEPEVSEEQDDGPSSVEDIIK